MYFKSKPIRRNKDWHFILIKGNINPKGYYNSLHVCSKQCSGWFHKWKTVGSKIICWPSQSDCVWLQYSILTSIQDTQKKINRISEDKSQCKSNESNRYLKNILPQNWRIHFLFRSPWNISHFDHTLGYKESLNKFIKIKITLYIWINHTG